MPLSPRQQDVLRAIAWSPIPVAVSDLLPDLMTSPPPAPDAPEEDPVRRAWEEERSLLYQAALGLFARGLMCVVHPSNGERQDLVAATPKGHAALV